MLRGLVAGLVLANLLFWAWTQGWLTGLVGVDPRADHEPQRLAAQVAPEAIRILPPAASAPAPLPTQCLEAGPFTPDEATQVEAAASAALPAEGWTLVRRDRPGAWLVYLGRYANREALQRRLDDLRRQGIEGQPLDGFAELEPGIVLGRFNNEAAAQELLRKLTGQRVRNVRVVRLTPPSTSHTLRLPRATPDLDTALATLKPKLYGHTLTPCRNGG